MSEAVESAVSEWARLPRDSGRVWYLSNAWFESFSRHVHQFPSGLTLLRSARSGVTLPMSFVRRRLAAELVSFTNYYSPYFDVLDLGPRNRRNELRSIFEEHGGILEKADVIRIQPLTAEVAQDFSEALRSAGYKVVSEAYSQNWYVEPTSWAAMLENISSKTKNTVRRKRRKLESEHALRIARFDSLSGLDVGMNDFHRVYYASWKHHEAYPAFIDDFVRKMAATGKLRLHVLYVDDWPAAAQIWFVEFDTAYIFKLAYDNEFAAYSVGSILSFEAMRQAVEDENVRRIDYLTGDDPYKNEWFNSSRRLFRVEGARLDSVMGRLVGWKWALQRRQGMSVPSSNWD